MGKLNDIFRKVRGRGRPKKEAPVVEREVSAAVAKPTYSEVVHDSSLSGKGVTGDPLSVAGGGGGGVVIHDGTLIGDGAATASALGLKIVDVSGAPAHDFIEVIYESYGLIFRGATSSENKKEIYMTPTSMGLWEFKFPSGGGTPELLKHVQITRDDIEIRNLDTKTKVWITPNHIEFQEELNPSIGLETVAQWHRSMTPSMANGIGIMQFKHLWAGQFGEGAGNYDSGDEYKVVIGSGSVPIFANQNCFVGNGAFYSEGNTTAGQLDFRWLSLQTNDFISMSHIDDGLKLGYYFSSGTGDWYSYNFASITPQMTRFVAATFSNGPIGTGTPESIVSTNIQPQEYNVGWTDTQSSSGYGSGVTINAYGSTVSNVADVRINIKNDDTPSSGLFATFTPMPEYNLTDNLESRVVLDTGLDSNSFEVDSTTHKIKVKGGGSSAVVDDITITGAGTSADKIRLKNVVKDGNTWTLDTYGVATSWTVKANNQMDSRVVLYGDSTGDPYIQVGEGEGQIANPGIKIQSSSDGGYAEIGLYDGMNSENRYYIRTDAGRGLNISNTGHKFFVHDHDFSTDHFEVDGSTGKIKVKGLATPSAYSPLSDVLMDSNASGCMDDIYGGQYLRCGYHRIFRWWVPQDQTDIWTWLGGNGLLSSSNCRLQLTRPRDYPAMDMFLYIYAPAKMNSGGNDVCRTAVPCKISASDGRIYFGPITQMEADAIMDAIYDGDYGQRMIPIQWEWIAVGV